MFAGCGAIVADQVYGGELGRVGVALAFGLVIMVMVYATGHLSGAHVNPAVTLAFTISRHFPLREAVAYIAAQCAGAIVAALALWAIWPDQPAQLGARTCEVRKIEPPHEPRVPIHLVAARWCPLAATPAARVLQGLAQGKVLAGGQADRKDHHGHAVPSRHQRLLAPTIATDTIARVAPMVLLGPSVRRSRARCAGSPPWKLGIDIQGSCNVKPPCVYCLWDLAKEREGANVDVPFNLQTLREYGPLFDNAAVLVNCSIGEPFMMREMDLLLDEFGSRGKVLELTTNGQILTETNIRKLLGRNVHLYISLDAATAQTYAKLRNDTFERLIANVRRLVQAKGGPGRLPLVPDRDDAYGGYG